VGDRPITSGYRNDARRIDTGGVSICRGRTTCPGDGSDVALTGLWIGARRDTERLRRRRVRGAAVQRHGAEVSWRKAGQPVRASARGRRRRQLQPLLGGLKSDISRGPRSAKSRLMHLQQKHGRSKWNIFKQRAEPRC